MTCNTWQITARQATLVLEVGVVVGGGANQLRLKAVEALATRASTKKRQSRGSCGAFAAPKTSQDLAGSLAWRLGGAERR